VEAWWTRGPEPEAVCPLHRLAARGQGRTILGSYWGGEWHDVPSCTVAKICRRQRAAERSRALVGGGQNGSLVLALAEGGTAAGREILLALTHTEAPGDAHAHRGSRPSIGQPGAVQPSLQRVGASRWAYGCKQSARSVTSASVSISRCRLSLERGRRAGGGNATTSRASGPSMGASVAGPAGGRCARGDHPALRARRGIVSKNRHGVPTCRSHRDSHRLFNRRELANGNGNSTATSSPFPLPLISSGPLRGRPTPMWAGSLPGSMAPPSGNACRQEGLLLETMCRCCRQRQTPGR